MRLTSVFLTFLFLSLNVFASDETLVLTCKMKPVAGQWDSNKEIGSLKVTFAANDDEGYYTFTVSGPLEDEAGNGVNLNGSFVDSMGDDEAAFLNSGAQRLYTGSYSHQDGFENSSVYLSNDNGVVGGMLRLPYFEAKLTSCSIPKGIWVGKALRDSLPDSARSKLPLPN